MWWRKRKASGDEQWTDGAALRILKGYRFLQIRWVRLMSTMVRGWTVRKQKIFLLIAMVPATMYCLGLVYNGVKGKGMELKVRAIETGEHIGLPKIDSTKISK